MTSAPIQSGSREGLVGRGQLDLGDHQPGVVAEELVDLPQVAFVLDVVAALVDQPADAQRQQAARVGRPGSGSRTPGACDPARAT